MAFTDRLKHAWNAFLNGSTEPRGGYGASFYNRQDRVRLSRGNEKSMVNAVYNRIALDVAATTIEHVETDENGKYQNTVDSGLNNCLNLEANIDQTSRSFIQDLVLSMIDEGCIAICPIDTHGLDPLISDAYDIDTMRIGKVVEWYPRHVKVDVYCDRDGTHKHLVFPKRVVGIIENPFYAVMNTPNSTLQRLIRKLNLLDAIDEASGSGKLDLIIQLPYVIKTESRRAQAEKRRKDIEVQLASSKYGVAYTDGTERITQLNRSVENKLLSQIEYLTSMLYSQLGLTAEIMNGTADEATMLNYYNRIIEPIVSAIADEIKRKFLSKTARTKGQSIFFYRDPFRLVPVNQLADIADKFTRNEIISSNEMRSVVGLKPSKDPKADELSNKNISQSSEEATPPAMATNTEENDGGDQDV